MSQIVLTNLLTVGNFENTGWSGGSYDSSVKKYGNYSLKLTGSTGLPETLSNTTAGYPIVQGHTYYGRYEIYHNGASGTAGIYMPIAEPNFIEGQSLGTAGQWNIVSAVNVRSNWGSGDYQFRIDYNNAYTAGTVWVDGAMWIDLTACFGAGNEPTKAWMDENIPFFEGTYNYPPVNIKAKINNNWIDCSGYYTKIDGEWKSIDSIKVNSNGWNSQ